MITPDYFSILDYWFYEVGVNLYPADTREKGISGDGWKVWQNQAQSSEIRTQ